MVVAAVSSRVPNTVIHGLQKDSRFLMIGEQLQADMVSKIEEIGNYPDFVWERFAAVVGSERVTYLEVRHRCMEGTLTAGAFVDLNVFEDLSRSPLQPDAG